MWAIRLSGIVLVVISSAVIGFAKSHSLTARYKKLLIFCDGMDNLYEYIEQGGVTLDDAIKSSFSKCKFLRIDNGRYRCIDGDLRYDEKIMIDNFFESLGFSVKKAECSRISGFKLKIKTYLNDAQKDMLEKSKIYKMLGICIGLAIGILLI